ncbi:FAD-binding domain-containing protein [Buchnera aphidicola]|uniref:FAD-binding domain-containing protein n=1 Tax=Buchnera aphidicola TaxID=9 RepID=UPI002092B550|nr:FAD-binding domain-containing protein [Buchnera aphidicola]USS94513.1 deoxyribodipyrimidine photo-lyase [Buchnera aphidicola (Periphyllus lyropictus)]
MNNLVWFRNDLRIEDNLALNNACKNKKKNIIALFMSTTKQWKKHNISDIQAFFIYKRLLFLKKKLKKLNISFLYKELNNFSDSVKYLLLICKKYKINKVFYNYQYEYNEKKRDLNSYKLLSINKINMYGFHDSILINPKMIKTNSKKAYKVFSFFKKKALFILNKNSFFNKKKYLKNCSILKRKKLFLKFSKEKIPYFNFYKKKFNKKYFPIKDKKIFIKIKNFFKKKIKFYAKNKDFPYLNNTSFFSVYLSLGIFSVRKIFYHIKILKKKDKNSFIFLEKLLWREFFKHLVNFYPILSRNGSLKTFKTKIKWKNNINHLNSWKNGCTGFPIIDAGMRQLNKIGWMHNRLRMLTSNFLVKNLLINWRLGEQYFMLKLIDSDYSLNNSNWQWISSIGTDSSFYIRTFNPYIQSKKFDCNGIFIKKYIKELKNVPIKYIHKPYLWLKKNEPYSNYPKPIVEYEKVKNIFLKKIK